MVESLAHIGPYRVLGLLGRGSVGTVYRAQHQDDGRLVALKTLPVCSEAFLPTIRREIHALSRLHHPGIVQILESGTHQGVPWLAMELVEGSTLREFCGGPAREAVGRPFQDILSVARRLCDVLGYLHGEGLIHRDLKPDNILVRVVDPPPAGIGRRSSARRGSGNARRPKARAASDERLAASSSGSSLAAPPESSLAARGSQLAASPWPMLVDFGLASEFSGLLNSRDSLRMDSAASGTLLYMSPEQLEGRPLDARADIYALGCILYELLCGHPPFEGSAWEVCQGHLERDPRPLSERVPGLPASLEDLVLRLLSKEPRERPGYATDIAAALAALGAKNGWSSAEPIPRAYLYRSGFTGRAKELDTLLGHLDGLKAGRGALVFVGGESGVGKTRLLVELARRAERQSLRVLATDGPVTQTDVVLEGGALGPESGAAPLGVLRKPLQAIGDRCRERGRGETKRLLGQQGRLLAVYEPTLGELPGVEAQPLPPELPSEAARHHLYTALLECFTALARVEPLVLLLDDLHWADELSLGFLQFLADGEGSLGRVPFLVVAAYRTEEVGAGSGFVLGRLLEGLQTRRITLERLEPGALARMVGEMLALDPPPEPFASFLFRHSEGNPFFVAEYLRTAVAEGLLTRDDAGRWQIRAEEDSEAAYEKLPLPGALRELVGRRLDGLGPSARRLAEAAAVLGREVDAGVLSGVFGALEAEMLEASSELVARQVLEEASRGALRFVHDKIREVAYDTIAKRRRQALHRAAAQVVEQKLGTGRHEHLAAIAHHWDRGGRKIAAARYRAQAGQRAASSYAAKDGLEALDLAIPVLERAQDDLENVKALMQALDARGRLLNQLGRFDDSEADARELARLARATGDELMLGRALRGWGNALYSTGNYEAASQCFNDSLSAVQGVGDAEEICETRSLIGWIHSSRGEYELAEREFQAGLATPGLASDSSRRFECLTRRGLMLAQKGDLPQALQIYEALLEQYEERGDEFSAATMKASIGQACRNLGQTERALALLQEATEVFRRLQASQYYLLHSYNMGVLLSDQGSFGRAAVVFQEVRQVAERHGELAIAAVTEVSLSRCELFRGHIARALELAEAGVRAFQELGDKRWLAGSLLWKGKAYAAIGDHEETDACFLKAKEMALEIQSSILAWRACAHWCCALLHRAAASARARSLAMEAMTIVPEAQNLAQVGQARLLLDLIRIRESTSVDLSASWERFWSDLAQLDKLAGAPELLEAVLLAGAQLAVDRAMAPEAAKLAERYRAMASPENLLHEVQARLIEAALALRSGETTRAETLRAQARGLVEGLLRPLPEGERAMSIRVPAFREALATA